MSKEEYKSKSLEELREEHKDVLENKAVQAICNWKDPLADTGSYITEEEYRKNAERIFKGNHLKNYFSKLFSKTK